MKVWNYILLFNNYLPKPTWISENSHQDEVEVTIFADITQVTSFSIIILMIIRENNIIDQFPTPKH